MLRDGEGQASLASRTPRGRKELDMAEQPNSNTSSLSSSWFHTHNTHLHNFLTIGMKMDTKSQVHTYKNCVCYLK